MTKYQRAYVPMKVITITNGGYGEGSGHPYSYALDLAGKDSGKDPVFAPFDCKVTGLYQPKTKDGKIDTGHAPEVWLTSTQPVLCANGYYGIMTISLTHSKETYNLKKGQKFKQFDVVLHEGNQGVSYGNHIHMELSKGDCPGWDIITKKGKKYYVNKNKVKPDEYLFATEDTVIRQEVTKGKRYHFKKESEMTYKVCNVPSEPLIIRSKPFPLGKKIGELYNKDEVIKFNDNKQCLIYHYGCLGYTPKKYLKKK